MISEEVSEVDCEARDAARTAAVAQGMNLLSYLGQGLTTVAALQAHLMRTGLTLNALKTTAEGVRAVERRGFIHVAKLMLDLVEGERAAFQACLLWGFLKEHGFTFEDISATPEQVQLILEQVQIAQT